MQDKIWPIQLTLSNRDPLAFRMLLGRQALNGNVIIDPIKSMVTKKITPKKALEFYND